MTKHMFTSGFTQELAAALLIALGSAHVFPAHAQSGDCTGFQDVSPEARLRIGQISDAKNPRVHFLKNAGTQRGCPSGGPACRDKAYLVSGDTVIVSATAGDYVCADYVNAKGFVRSGWLPQASVALRADEPAANVESWIGVWSGGPEQRITITKGKAPGEVGIEGEATFGALDPARTARGGVNVGSLDVSVRPDKGFVAFTMADEGTALPYGEGDQYDCRVRMQRIGLFLLVEDNRNCGGMNVSFSGAYRRKP
jgi:hypothetical protein